ncbi:anthranilate phosphoribosyltransferase [Alloacidobacterium dinghuense]|uniref:Anthranilate phosphoribosyltransferase n=1 Tax=Alloacidobacterium dinghuense TaxID=2763107 RepID=A0A7G8BHU1_9BACT|nr:anthranilate phosphoribosyltransferase [Alloacidobacterium dinghuense]QNI32111.1 anthranilate phosphoribosyltransferase [Alloacidobacterium dinghuense]
MATFPDLLHSIQAGQRTLTRAEARTALREMLTGETSDAEIAELLTVLARRGETVEELTGFAETMRELAIPVPLTDQERSLLIDTCGTGGDDRGTFNISTGAALVAAAAGAKVAKHGNRAVTSKCGSADVLEALGIAVALPPELAVESLRAAGFMFLYAPALHPTMKRVLPVRRALGFRTIFNLAGPLTNPAGAPAQIMGVFAPDRVSLVAETMLHLGVRHAFVVHGSDGLDELTITGASHVAEVRGDEASWRASYVHPEDAGLSRASLSELAGGATAAENAATLERIFAGEKGPKRDIVLLNAAAALVAGRIATDLREGAERAAEAIDSGAARKTVTKLRMFAEKV